MWNVLRACRLYGKINGLLHKWVIDGYGRLYGVVEFEDGHVECVESSNIRLLGNPFEDFYFEEE